MLESQPSRRHLIRTSAAALTAPGIYRREHGAGNAAGRAGPSRCRRRRRRSTAFRGWCRSTSSAGAGGRAARRIRTPRGDEDQGRRRALCADVREKIAQCFGPFPEKTPLNAQVTGMVERDAYTIEKVIFESRPGFLVTANLYVPKGHKGPLPGVVGTCGHSTNGKAADAYQSFAQGLARMGYVVLIFDPIGQGERLQYGHLDDKDRSRIGVGAEHLHAGNQQFLVGEFFGSWRAWDGIRALDYLLRAAGGRSEARRHHRQLRRRHHDHLAVRRRTALDDGRAELLRHHLPPQPGERTARRHRAVPAAAPGACISTTPISSRPWPPSRSSSCAKEKDFFDVRGARRPTARLQAASTRCSGPEDNVSSSSARRRTATRRRTARRCISGSTTCTAHVSDAQHRAETELSRRTKTLLCTPRGRWPS